MLTVVLESMHRVRYKKGCNEMFVVRKDAKCSLKSEVVKGPKLSAVRRDANCDPPPGNES